MIYFSKFFGSDINYFDLITKSHNLYDLRESVKETVSLRTGVYLSKVDNSKFNLMRCSTNLSGPTENFNEVDHSLLDMVNTFFSTKCNHVLAQVYHNKHIDGKNKKAKIKTHSDKTKDMDPGGVIVFCTFYDRPTTSFSKIRFTDKSFTNIKLDFTLENNSLLIIDLDTNAKYTHEIIPAPGEVENLPLRLGYVMRCSNVVAYHDRDTGETFIDGVKMHEPTPEDVKQITDLYYKENTETERFKYPKIYCSLNKGDYMRPVDGKE
jgi:hypothetical protein